MHVQCYTQPRYMRYCSIFVKCTLLIFLSFTSHSPLKCEIGIEKVKKCILRCIELKKNKITFHILKLKNW